MTGDEDIQRVALYEALKKYDELKPMPPQDFADEWLGYYMDFRRKWLGFGLSRSGLAGVCLLVFVTLLSLFSGPAAVVALGLAEVFK